MTSDNNAARRGRIPGDRRMRFEADEQRHDWLPLLLDAYAVADEGVARGIAGETGRGRALACDRGCAACCRSHTTIPVYPLELVGISWYATEKVHGPVGETLKRQLRAYNKGDPCPFLVDEACGIHPLRPMACRQFNVFGERCREGEDAWYTRREDVLDTIRKYIDEALAITLPFYGVQKKSGQKRVIRDGSIHGIARVLQEIDWTGLAEKMEQYENRRHQ